MEMTAWGTFLESESLLESEIRPYFECFRSGEASLHLDRLISRAQVSSAALMVFPLGVLGRTGGSLQSEHSAHPPSPQLHAASGNSLHDDDSLSVGGVDVHVIHAGPSSADDFQVVGGIDDVGRDLRC